MYLVIPQPKEICALRNIFACCAKKSFGHLQGSLYILKKNLEKSCEQRGYDSDICCAHEIVCILERTLLSQHIKEHRRQQAVQRWRQHRSSFPFGLDSSWWWWHITKLRPASLLQNHPPPTANLGCCVALPPPSSKILFINCFALHKNTKLKNQDFEEPKILTTKLIRCKTLLCSF